MKMQTFIYNFNGFNPVGASMYIRADDQEEANEMFKAELPLALYARNIKTDGDLKNTITIKKIEPGKRTFMIANGEY
jgi:hypothetical protein